MIVNPYNYQDSSIKIGEYVSTNNSNMLFEYNVYNNNIFVCLASDIFKAKEKLLDEEAIMKIYFSFLYAKNITNEREFIMQKVELIKKNNELINENFINKNNFIALLNTIYNNSASLKYENFGIKYININIHSNINSNISLESIFKLFNSSDQYPLIKYNPGKKLENLYRLYCLEKKVPLLSKTVILKYTKL